MSDAVSTVDMKITTAMEITTRDINAMRGHLTKVNEVQNKSMQLDAQLKLRPNFEDLDRALEKFN